MSGFLVSRRIDAEQSFLSRRGGAFARTLEIDGYYVTHYVSQAAGGISSPRPSGGGKDLLCLWDGEIFNRSPAQQIDEFLIDSYLEHGDDFVRHLEGDYAIALYDFSRRILIVATDAFGTKPLYLSGTEVSSYRSALGDGERLAPNTMAVIDLDHGVAQQSLIRPFDFSHQHKQSYDDWIEAFERAVQQRATDGCYVPLSAGYDSGAIDCALGQLGVSYRSFSIAGRENVDLLRLRGQDRGEILPMDGDVFAERSDFLLAHCEPAKFPVKIFTGEHETYEVHEDRASRGLALIHSRAAAEGRSVFLSGHGVDEIFAANRHWPGTRFPDPLQPWLDFDGNWQVAYLAKEEHVAGACGVEGRFPFLDRHVVQEFLWLSAELKSRRYKAPLDEYMRRCNYPFDENIKTGFNPLPLTPTP